MTMWKNLGLKISNYFNEELMEAEALRIFNNSMLTDDDFIYLKPKYLDNLEENKDNPEDRDCYSMTDLWLT